MGLVIPPCKSSLVWMIAVALIKFCSHVSLFPKSICYGLNQSSTSTMLILKILVVCALVGHKSWCPGHESESPRDSCMCHSILIQIHMCHVRWHWVMIDVTFWCYLPLERLVSTCFCVLAHKFSMAHITQTSRVVWLIIIYAPALMLIHHGSAGELGFPHLIFQPSWCVIFGHSTCGLIVIELKILICFWIGFYRFMMM